MFFKECLLSKYGFVHSYKKHYLDITFSGFQFKRSPKAVLTVMEVHFDGVYVRK